MSLSLIFIISFEVDDRAVKRSNGVFRRGFHFIKKTFHEIVEKEKRVCILDVGHEMHFENNIESMNGTRVRVNLNQFIRVNEIFIFDLSADAYNVGLYTFFLIFHLPIE